MDLRPARIEQAVEALEGNFWGLWSRFGRGKGCQLHEAMGATWFETPISSLPYNTVIRFQALPDQAEAAVQRIIDSYSPRQVSITWVVHPSSTPGLGEILPQHGFKEAEQITCMWADLVDMPTPDPTPPDLKVGRVEPGPQVDALLDLVSWRWDVAANDRGHLQNFLDAFDVSGAESAVQCWAAWKDGQPVAKALLNLHDGAAGIYGVSTRPEARGRGLARLLTLQALHFARAQGYQLGVLHSSPMAESLYAKIGFERTGTHFKVFAPAGEFHI